jgi:hypothetical protein
MHDDAVGWTAAALMVLSFSCREARHLRPLAVATRLAFVAYGAMAGLAPVQALQLPLRPINLRRWGRALQRSRRGSAPGSHARRQAPARGVTPCAAAEGGCVVADMALAAGSQARPPVTSSTAGPSACKPPA